MVIFGKPEGMDMGDVSKLLVEIKNSKPVELTDFAQSMQALAGEYTRYTHDHTEYASEDTPREVKLYVKEIRPGSIIAEVVAMAPGTVFAIQHANTIIQFGKHIIGLLTWYIGKDGEAPEAVEKPTLQALSSIIEPIAKDGGANLNIGTFNNNGNLVLNFYMNSKEANAAQNNIRREIELLKEPVTGIHEQVVLYWAQAKNQTTNKTGDKARIESIYRGDVKVLFSSESIKAQMIYGEDNPFKKAFLVDVVVETINDKPVLYKVVNCHESFDQ